MATAGPAHDQARTAVVAGASRGLGLGLARELASRGWRVVATARDPAAATGLAEAAADAGGRIEVAELDIDLPASVDALEAQLAGQRLDLVFVNAGVAGPEHQSVDAATPEEVGALMLTNAIAPVRLARKLLPLVPDGGTVAFMSSRMGSVADNTSGGMDLYRASKAALNSLTRGFAAGDIGDRPVAVRTFHPGWVRTAMGGDNAALGIEESVRGIADVLEADTAPGHRFVDHQGGALPW